MDVIITQACGHQRTLNVPPATSPGPPGSPLNAQEWQIAKWSNKICERCLWAQIAPGTPFPGGHDEAVPG